MYRPSLRIGIRILATTLAGVVLALLLWPEPEPELRRLAEEGGPGEDLSGEAAGLLPLTDILPRHASLQHTDDLPAMRERRIVRALVSPSPTDFFSVQGELKGLQVALLRDLEEYLNRDAGRDTLAVQVVFIPVPFNQLIPSLLEGRGDIAAAILTETPERAAQVDFVGGLDMELAEVIVHGPGVEGLEDLDDLAGRSAYVLRDSSYAEHLARLNQRLEQDGLKPVEIIEADARLSTADILELVNAGLVGITVADDYKARLWAQVLPKIRVRDDVVLEDGVHAAWAVREDNPKLQAAIRAASKDVRQGTLLGNIFIRRYLEDPRWISDPLARRERERFVQYADLFKEYGHRYGFDWLALVAQAYQESGLDHGARSHAGAVGIMQLLPRTAADPNVGIPDIEDLENNIHAGAKYMAFIKDRYFSDPSLDHTAQLAFSWAAYNAGPRKVRLMRNRAEAMGLDPDRWFGHVEYAALDMIGQETVRYVSNIYKYYVAYTLSQQLLEARQQARTGRARDD